jgi:hypothetical protein
MKINEKHRILGEAIMKDYSIHGKKEIVVSFTDSQVLEYLSVSVDGLLTVGFSKREMEKQK